jgi:hypothetical protein
MTADGGLRQLQDGAQLRDGQLVPFEEEQHPPPRQVPQHAQLVEDRFNPHIRI